MYKHGTLEEYNKLHPDVTKAQYEMYRIMSGIGSTEYCKQEREQEREQERIISEAKSEVPVSEHWKFNTSFQKNRYKVVSKFSPDIKNKYIKWAKDFDNDSMGYINFISGDAKLPVNRDLRVLALGYLSDISECKRLHNEENIRVEWTKVPYGITQDEWDNFDDSEDIEIEYNEYTISEQEQMRQDRIAEACTIQ